MAKKQNIRFAVRHLKTEQFSLFPENYPGNLSEPPNMELKIGFRADKTKRMVGAYNLINFDVKGKALIRLEVSCHFKIAKSSWEKLKPVDHSISLPGHFLAHLAAVAFGAARGILHARTEGTPLNGLVLPLVNFNDIVKDDAEIAFD